MKILFLDIDGVLNSTRSSLAFANSGEPNQIIAPLAFSTVPEYGEPVYAQETFRLDPVAIGLLRRVIADTGAKIVISSSWRNGSAVEHFHKMFDCYGWDTREIIIDFTPQFGRIRGDEINKWFEKNQHLGVTHYVIVDDHADFYPPQQQHLVQTNLNIGFSHVTHFQCIEKLGAVSSAQ